MPLDDFFYILKNKKPVKVGYSVYSTWMYAHWKERRVAWDEFGGVQVSTVFLGLDHSFGHGPPLLFETMIFNGPHDGWQMRATTWEEAEKAHQAAVAIAKVSYLKVVK
jgi:hypothetical protein